MLVEVQLEIFVGEINAELLEAVLGEILESEDIEDGDTMGVMGAAFVDDRVDAGDKPYNENKKIV